MEVHEKKKFMPTITNYLSDNEEDIDLDNEISIVETSPSMSNYAEWKKLKQTQSRSPTNGKRKNRVRSDGRMEPLGDISSGEELEIVDEEQPLSKIFSNLLEDLAGRKSTSRTRKNSKKPTKYLLYCQMKHQEYQISGGGWSFSELCKLCQELWDGNNEDDKEDLEIILEDKIEEYQGCLRNIRKTLLSDYQGKLKLKTIPNAQPREHSDSNSSSSASYKPPNQDSPKATVVTEESVIPERLANLAGNASVYHTNRNSNNANSNTKSSGRHSVFSFKNNINSNTTELKYVTGAMNDGEDDAVKGNKNDDDDNTDDSMANESDQDAAVLQKEKKSNKTIKKLSRITCLRNNCCEEPISDNRWDKDYCSAACLIMHCKEVFNDWMKSEMCNKQSLTNNGRHKDNINDKQRMDRGSDDDDSDDSVTQDDYFFASLQNNFVPDICSPPQNSNINLDDDSDSDSNNNNNNSKDEISLSNQLTSATVNQSDQPVDNDATDIVKKAAPKHGLHIEINHQIIDSDNDDDAIDLFSPPIIQCQIPPTNQQQNSPSNLI